jgi:hypothetical protein
MLDLEGFGHSVKDVRGVVSVMLFAVVRYG